MLKVSYGQLIIPVIKALTSLGGSGTNKQIYEKVIELEEFDEETLAMLQKTSERKRKKSFMSLNGLELTLEKQAI